MNPSSFCGVAYASAGLWGQTGVPTPSDVQKLRNHGIGFVSAPVGPTSNLAEYAQLLGTLKNEGFRVHVTVHYDGQGDAYAFWPYRKPLELVAFNEAVAAFAASLLDSGDTWEVCNEASADPSLGSTWEQQVNLYRPGGVFCMARDGVRRLGVKASMYLPLCGSQNPAEADNVLNHGEMDLSWFSGWEGIGCHAYLDVPVPTFPTEGLMAEAMREFSSFQALSDRTGLPWIATEYGCGNALPWGPAALYALRTVLGLFGLFGSCRGVVCWQYRRYDPPSGIETRPACLAAIGSSPALAATTNSG